MRERYRLYQDIVRIKIIATCMPLRREKRQYYHIFIIYCRVTVFLERYATFACFILLRFCQTIFGQFSETIG